MDSNTFRQLYTFGIWFLCIPAILANFAVLVSSGLILGRGRTEPRVAYMLLGSIALADLFATSMIVAGLVFPHASRTPAICAALIGGQVSCSLISMISIFLIGLERFFYIVHGIKYDYILTSTRIRLLIFLAWIMGISFGLIPELLTMSEFMNSEFHCRFVNSNKAVIIVAASIAMPALLITIVLYSVIFIHVRRITKAIGGPDGSTKIKLKSILVVFISCISFLVTWGPYMVCGFLYAVFCRSEGLTCSNIALALTSPLAVLGFFNSILNPIIYAWWHRPFNEAIRKIVCRKRMREKARNKMCDASIDTISEKCVF